MKTPTLLLTVVPFVLLSACGGKDKAPAGATAVAPIGAAAPADLSNLYPQELLRTKFDRATVVCTLEAPFEVREQSGVEMNGTNTSTYTVDLLESSILPREGVLQTRGPLNDVVARVRLDRFRIVRTLVNDTEDGHRYVSEFAPVLEAALEYRQTPSRGPRGSYGTLASDSARTTVSEIPQARPALAAEQTVSSADGSASAKTGVRLGCRLDAAIKPAYARQFERVK